MADGMFGVPTKKLNDHTEREYARLVQAIVAFQFYTSSHREHVGLG